MAREGRSSNCGLHLALVFVQFMAAGCSLVMQVTLEEGVNKLVLGFYTFLVPIVILGSASLIFERKQDIRFSSSIALRLLFLGFMIFVISFLFLFAIASTSASFVAALQPLSPVFTATCAVVFGVEALNWRRHDGQAKVLGILLCVAGAAVMALYRGSCLLGEDCFQGSNYSSPPTSSLGSTSRSVFGLGVFELGTLCAILGNLFSGALGTFAAKLLADCPAPATILSSTFVIAAVASGIAALATTMNDLLVWAIPPRAVLVVFLNGGFTVTLLPMVILLGVMKLGPTIVSCYAPANPILTAFLSLVFLGTSIYLGNIIGAVLLILGLFIVSWSEEEHLRLKGIQSCGDLEEALVREFSPVK